MYAVIMAGGSGTRFWPASRERLPKQFLRITSDRTMVEETVKRARAFTEGDRIWVVINQSHAVLARQLLGESGSLILEEPTGRNTAPCIGLAALHCRRHGEDEPMVVLPADHFIADAAEFASVVKAGGEVARSGAIVTIGVTPTRPETGYGYIEMGAESDRVGGREVFQVVRFVEKPDRDTALRYLSGGRHLWNSGIFLFTPRTILDQIKQHLPELYRGLAQIDRAIGQAEYRDVVETVYAGLQPISIDYGVMEKTRGPVRVLRGDFGWSDVGSWQAIYQMRNNETDASGNLLLGEALTVDARRNLVYSAGSRLVTLLGVEGLIVVDTPDALMVADINRSQDVKQFSELLRQNGRDSLC